MQRVKDKKYFMCYPLPQTDEPFHNIKMREMQEREEIQVLV